MSGYVLWNLAFNVWKSKNDVLRVLLGRDDTFTDEKLIRWARK